MKENIQNKINQAVKSGVKLGFDLCDIDYEENHSIIQDLNNTKNFKTLDIFTGIQEVVKMFISGDRKAQKILKKFCCNYSDEYYAVYHIEDHYDKVLQLNELIKLLCQKFGNNINLNWIDVSTFTSAMYQEKKLLPIGIFYDLSFNGDISQWDVSNIENMAGMFSYSKFNGDISKWNVSSCRDMSFMFQNSEFDGDISKWDVSHVCDMRNMFQDSKFNGDISKWNVSNCQNMAWMFFGSKFNGDISKWDVRNVQDMRSMFKISQFNGDISQWNINNVKYMGEMFYDDESFLVDLSKWDLRKKQKKYIQNMFGGWNKMLQCKEYLPNGYYQAQKHIFGIY